MKFEGKTFYLYVSQKEVSVLPSYGPSRVQPRSFLQPFLHRPGRLQPAAASPCAWDTGRGAGAAARWQCWGHLPAPAGILLEALEPAGSGLDLAWAGTRGLP